MVYVLYLTPSAFLSDIFYSVPDTPGSLLSFSFYLYKLVGSFESFRAKKKPVPFLGGCPPINGQVKKSKHTLKKFTLEYFSCPIIYQGLLWHPRWPRPAQPRLGPFPERGL
jgi:hypothetical protein